MFVQFIEGPISDAEGFERQLERWQTDLAPGATGFLGTTAGVTTDGVGFVAARFESDRAASANSDRPEQGQWWQETEKCFGGEVSFLDCDEVMLMADGGSDDAGFVQVIRGRVNDLEAARRIAAEMDETPEDRPDVIGGLLGVNADGQYAQVVYFTSEEEAREGEASGEGLPEDFLRLHEEGPRFLDLPDPWLASA